jgi:hypothetical protein
MAMRFGWLLAGALLLAACGQKDGSSPGTLAQGAAGEAAAGAEQAVRPPLDYAALSGYDDTWFLSGGWPGEYPPGFTVLDAEVKVPARARPNPTDPQDIACLLPQYANYQIWNAERTAEDDIEYFVATKKVPVTALQDATVEFIGESGKIETLELKTGDVLTYLRYVGEGFTVMSFNGREFDINEGELADITDITNTALVENLWARVTCLGGKQAWLMFDEVIGEPGIYPSPITGYGEASDVEPGEVDAVREAIATDAYGLDQPTDEVIPPPEE